MIYTYGAIYVLMNLVLDAPDLLIQFSVLHKFLVISVEQSRSSPLTSNEHRFENSFTGFPRPRPEAEKLRMPLPEHPASRWALYFNSPGRCRVMESSCPTSVVKSGYHKVVHGSLFLGPVDNSGLQYQSTCPTSVVKSGCHTRSRWFNALHGHANQYGRTWMTSDYECWISN